MSHAQGFKCSAHASCILGKYHFLCKNLKSAQYQCCSQTRNDRWLHFEKNLKTNLVKTSRQEYSIKSIVKIVTKFISVKHQGP